MQLSSTLASFCLEPRRAWQTRRHKASSRIQHPILSGRSGLVHVGDEEEDPKIGVPPDHKTERN